MTALVSPHYLAIPGGRMLRGRSMNSTRGSYSIGSLRYPSPQYASSPNLTLGTNHGNESVGMKSNAALHRGCHSRSCCLPCRRRLHARAGPRKPPPPPPAAAGDGQLSDLERNVADYVDFTGPNGGGQNGRGAGSSLGLSPEREFHRRCPGQKGRPAVPNRSATLRRRFVKQAKGQRSPRTRRQLKHNAATYKPRSRSCETTGRGATHEDLDTAARGPRRHAGRAAGRTRPT